MIAGFRVSAIERGVEGSGRNQRRGRGFHGPAAARLELLAWAVSRRLVPNGAQLPLDQILRIDLCRVVANMARYRGSGSPAVRNRHS